jgi:hypothetical protein
LPETRGKCWRLRLLVETAVKKQHSSRKRQRATLAAGPSSPAVEAPNLRTSAHPLSDVNARPLSERKSAVDFPPVESDRSAPCHLYTRIDVAPNSPCVATDCAEPKPPTIEWDENEQQILIDGVPLDQYKGTAISDSGWDKAEFERNAWIYVQCMKNVTYWQIRAKMERMRSGWDAIASIQGIKPRAIEFAKRLRLQPPAHRRRGRRPGDGE